MSRAEPLDLERRGAIAWLTLNRPDDANAIDVTLAEALLDAIRRIAADAAVRGVVVTGAGRMFCAGGDIKAFVAGDDPGIAIDAITGPLHRAILRLIALDKPILTLINGPAAGAGLGLALLGDVVLAARSAHFTAAYTAIGLTPDAGTSWLLPRLIGLRRATEMMLTNRRVDAEEAVRIGLVSAVTDDEALAGEGAGLAERLAAGSIGALARSRRLLADGLQRGLAEQLDLEAREIAASAIGPEGRAGVAAFLERRGARSA